MPLEQLPAALEQLLQRVEEQALAEAPRARQEVMRAFLDQLQGVAGLVHVVAVALPEIAETLDADRQQAPSHGSAYTVLLNGPGSSSPQPSAFSRASAARSAVSPFGASVSAGMAALHRARLSHTP